MPRRIAVHPSEAGLRSRVLSASAALLEDEGLAALSMREVARRAGVSHQAPYHHFPDRESILAAVVAQGFEELAQRLKEALDGAEGSDLRGLIRRAGAAYVDFALDRPGLFRVMFRPELVDQRRFAEVEAAGDKALFELERLVGMIGGPGDVPVQKSLHWSVVHGLAGLLVDGALGVELGTDAARRRHLTEVLELFAEGVASSVEKKPPPRRRKKR